MKSRKFNGNFPNGIKKTRPSNLQEFVNSSVTMRKIAWVGGVILVVALLASFGTLFIH